VDVVDALLDALEAQWAHAARATASDLVRPSRCPGWSVLAVLRHSVGVTAKFTEFASGATDHPRSPPGDLLGDRPDLALRATVDAARSAWPDADRSRRCHLPFGTFPADVAAGINLVDVLAHGWDAGSLGGSVFHCPDPVWSVGLEMAQVYLGDERDPHHFAAEVPVGRSASPEARFLGKVGRA
jgi:uncharacterized protein (TIGR03086 family)